MSADDKNHVHSDMPKSHQGNFGGAHIKPSKESVEASIDSQAKARGVSITPEEKQRYTEKALKN